MAHDKACTEIRPLLKRIAASTHTGHTGRGARTCLELEMNIVHYHPWAHSSRLQNEFRQVFGRLFGDSDSGGAITQWAPRVDIREEDKRFVILADIPGVDPKNIEVSMDKGVLSIKGERKSETNEETAKVKRVERSYGAFLRSFVLPDSADSDAISATGKNGVLEVSIPKKAQTTPRRIDVTH
jgi:HSP20 family protein